MRNRYHQPLYVCCYVVSRGQRSLAAFRIHVSVLVEGSAVEEHRDDSRLFESLGSSMALLGANKLRSARQYEIKSFKRMYEVAGQKGEWERTADWKMASNGQIPFNWRIQFRLLVCIGKKSALF